MGRKKKQGFLHFLPPCNPVNPTEILTQYYPVSIKHCSIRKQMRAEQHNRTAKGKEGWAKAAG